MIDCDKRWNCLIAEDVRSKNVLSVQTLES
jgi:hypothetical protein